MTIEEAKKELSKLIFELGFEDNVDDKIYALNMAIKALSQEPCDDIAQERYKDLCEYFGGAKDILKSREDFKAWLGRVKWHIRKAEELYEKYEYKKEPCDDAVSRQYLIDIAAKDGAYGYVSAHDIVTAPSVTQKSDNKYRKEAKRWKNKWLKSQKSGKWIYRRGDKYSCSKCGTTTSVDEAGIDEKPMYKFCPYCGARIFEPQESEE